MRKLENAELNRLSADEFKQADKTPVVVVLDNIRSLHNIGAMFRSGDAFLIEKIYLCGITATPPNKEIHKTALGATETVAWEYTENTLEAIQLLKEKGYTCISIEQAENAIMLWDFEPSKSQKYALILGNEVKGVQQEVVDASDHVIEIPQLGTKHSLNVSVSGGIVLWDFFRKLQRTNL